MGWGLLPAGAGCCCRSAARLLGGGGAAARLLRAGRCCWLLLRAAPTPPAERGVRLQCLFEGRVGNFGSDCQCVSYDLSAACYLIHECCPSALKVQNILIFARYCTTILILLLASHGFFRLCLVPPAFPYWSIKWWQWPCIFIGSVDSKRSVWTFSVPWKIGLIGTSAF